MPFNSLNTLIILPVAAMYAATAKISFMFTIPPGNITPIFPAAGLALAAVIIFEHNALIGIWLGSFAVNIISLMSDSMPSSQMGFTNLFIAAFIALGAMSGAAAGAFLVQRVCKDEHPLQSGMNVLVLIVLGGIVGCMISPSLGVLGLSLAGDIPRERFGYSWLTWWVGDATGTLVTAPLFLAWHHHRTSRLNPVSIFEAALLGFTTCSLCFFVFFRNVPGEYGILPILLWAAFRFNMRGVTTTAAVIALLATIGTNLGSSPFTGKTANESLLLLNSFLGVTITFALFLAGIMEEQRQAESKLFSLNQAFHESEERLRTLGDNLPDSYVYQFTQEADGSPRFLYFSAGLEKVHGIKVADVLADANLLRRQVAPEQAQALREAEAESFRKLTDFTMELRMLCRDDQWRWLQVCSRPRQSSNGQIIWDGVATNITSRKLAEMANLEAEKRLVESERQYRELVMLANSIILRWTREGIITFMNEFGQVFFGYSQEDIVGRHVIGAIVPESESSGRDLRKLMEEILIDPQKFERNINENMRRNGERVWIDWTNKVVLDDEGKIKEILSIGSDVTDRRLAYERICQLNHELQQNTEALERRVAERTAELVVAKEKAESADRLKSAFLATMSHELRTPLNSIIGFTGILLQGLAGSLNEEQHKQMSMVQKSSRHLLALINDVLDISKIEAGQLSLSYSNFDLESSIQKTIKSVSPLAEKNKNLLCLDIGEDVSTAYLDQRRFEQILLNLITNALKFTENGNVTLSCRSDKEHYVLSVSDTGIGIPEEELPGLFQPFHQIDTGLSRKREGTGLGLSICKKLTEMMGGTIRVQSREGMGSTFTIHFPKRRRRESFHERHTAYHRRQ